MPTYRATVLNRFTAGSGGGTNTWHFRTDNPIGIEDEPDTIMGWVRQFYTALAPQFPNTSTWTWNGEISEVGAQPTFAPTRTPWTVTGSNSQAGYGPSAGMACVTWRTELATRSGRGRTFMGPLSFTTVQNTDGSLGPSALAAFRAAANALVSSSNTNDNVGAIGVYSPTQGIFRDIVGATVTDQVAVLRSRRS